MLDLVAEPLPADGLVRDHENAAFALDAAARRHRLARRLAAVRTRHVQDRPHAEYDQARDARPGSDHQGRDRDRGEVPHRQEKKAVSLGLTPEGVTHLASLAGTRSRPAKP